MNRPGKIARIAVCFCSIATFSHIAGAQSSKEDHRSSTQDKAGASAARQEATAKKHVDDAVAVVERMNKEARLKDMLQQAKGVFILPTYGRAALGVGASGGAGVLLVKRDDGVWSDPAFYNIGGINIGAQAGAEGGPISMVLNSDKAVQSFMQKNNFSLSADAGLTVVDWARIAQGSTGLGDVVVWAGTKGLFGNVATIGVNDIRLNERLTNAYYHESVAVADVISGKFTNTQSDHLKKVLASSSTNTASGSSGASTKEPKTSSGNK
jgi:lipid-binding SYLF domain-containing protein